MTACASGSLKRSMLDLKDIDIYFNADSEQPQNKSENMRSRHSRFVRIAKLLLPSIAAVLIGVLLAFPSIQNDSRDFRLDITRPKQGELEKLHVENTVFYITDRNNRVNNFLAEKIDETEPGSKLIMLTKPEGIIPSSPDIWTNVKAPIGYYNQNTNILELRNDVELFYSEGMTVRTSEAFYDFGQSRGYGNKPVNGEGFMGNLSSQGFEILNSDSILAFTGHTEMTIKEESLQRKNR